jgi:hypothetical protein
MEIQTRFNRAIIKIKPTFWLSPVALTGFLTWLVGRRRPDRPFWKKLLTGVLGAISAISADVGHAMAHTFSAQLAGAPMDEIHLALDMPRTIYFNNQVPPKSHILRSLGGPVFNLFGLVTSLVWRILSPKQSLPRDLSEISAISHGLLFGGSLLPISIIDGGTILKWSLVEHGYAEVQADQRVRKTSRVFIVISAVCGAILVSMKLRKSESYRLSASQTKW